MSAWLPLAASAHAGDIDRLLTAMHALIAVLFVGWTLFFVYALVRFRRGRHARASYEGLRGRWPLVIVGLVAIAELALTFTLDAPAWSARQTLPAANQAFVVRVVAEQFAWNAHYAGPDGTFGRTAVKLVSGFNPVGLDRTDPAATDDVVSINQLNVPVDRDVIVYLSSKDVVHSFTLPQMRVKQDAIPGRVIPVWFHPTMRGQWEIVCSQLCGLGHYRMRGQYAVMDAAALTAWMAEQR